MTEEPYTPEKLVRSGFTGTQAGMTDAQKDTFRGLIRRINPDEFHHGDCIGADEDAHWLTRLETKAFIWVWPPEDTSKRAWCEMDERVWEDLLFHEGGCILTTIGWKHPAPYLERNQYIVNHATHLIACPGGYQEELRSGTWATVRRARKKGIPIFFIWPDGRVERRNKGDILYEAWKP